MQLSPNSTEAKDHSEYVKQSLKAQLEEQERRIDEVESKLQLMTKCFKEKIQDMNTQFYGQLAAERKRYEAKRKQVRKPTFNWKKGKI